MSASGSTPYLTSTELPIKDNILAFCENWLGGLYKIKGVPVAQAMSYDLVQLLVRVESTND